MLIGHMDITRLMIYMQQVVEEKLRDRKEFHNKRAKTGVSLGIRREMATGHLSNINKKEPLHHLLVQLHQGI